ncbi:hypothetical protein ABK040_009713 [Willaertia magna]
MLPFGQPVYQDQVEEKDADEMKKKKNNIEHLHSESLQGVQKLMQRNEKRKSKLANGNIPSKKEEDVKQDNEAEEETINNNSTTSTTPLTTTINSHSLLLHSRPKEENVKEEDNDDDIMILLEEEQVVDDNNVIEIGNDEEWEEEEPSTLTNVDNNMDNEWEEIQQEEEELSYPSSSQMDWSNSNNEENFNEENNEEDEEQEALREKENTLEITISHQDGKRKKNSSDSTGSSEDDDEDEKKKKKKKRKTVQRKTKYEYHLEKFENYTKLLVEFNYPLQTCLKVYNYTTIQALVLGIIEKKNSLQNNSNNSSDSKNDDKELNDKKKKKNKTLDKKSKEKKNTKNNTKKIVNTLKDDLEFIYDYFINDFKMVNNDETVINFDEDKIQLDIENKIIKNLNELYIIIIIYLIYLNYNINFKCLININDEIKITKINKQWIEIDNNYQLILLKNITNLFINNKYPNTIIGKELFTTIQEWFNEVITIYSLTQEFPYKEITQKITRFHQEILPKTLNAFQNHPIYILEKFIPKYEALYPKDLDPVTTIKGQSVYLRKDIFPLHTKEKWLREHFLKVKESELNAPYKIVKASKLSNSSEFTQLYGAWQCENYQLPKIENEKIPKNDRNVYELWSDRFLLDGCIHIKKSHIYNNNLTEPIEMKTLCNCCKKLKIDYAKAMTGFEVKRNKSFPKIDGIIILEKYYTELFELYEKEIKLKRERNEKKRVNKIIGNWSKLVRAMLAREYIKNKYENGNSSEGQCNNPNSEKYSEQI